MADKAVPDLDMTVGYHLEDAQGQMVWDVYQGQPNTWKLALIDLLKNPRLRSLYFLTGGIWLRLPL